jgi:filamentous hemagglutinin family protein
MLDRAMLFMKVLKQESWMFVICSCVCFSHAYPTLAQVSTDNTVSTKVINSGDTIKIIGGTRAGNNLFHSFAEFSVPNSSTAYFQNASNINNIISRVTGQSISNIDGILKTNGNANLFLINPSGIVFGANAQLDINGSFLATTANSIKFADGTEYSTTNKQTSPLLTVSIPVGLQFGDSVGSIVNRSIASPNGETNFLVIPVGLKVAPNQTIAFVGGDVTFDGGNLTAARGGIEIGSVGNNSFVSLATTKQGWTLGYEGVQNFRDIHFLNAAVVDVSGSLANNHIRGQNIKLTDYSSILNATVTKKDGGNLEITADNSVEVVNSFLLNQVGRLTDIGLNVIATGNGGDLTVSTKHLLVKDGGFISSGTLSQGNAGNLTIDASDSVEVVGANSLLTTSTDGTGKGGELKIDTKNLVVKDGGRIEAATLGIGEGGNIDINASESVEFAGWQDLGEGIVSISGLSASAGIEDGSIAQTENGGNLSIETPLLMVKDGAEITVSNFGSGDAGTLAIDADSILLDDRAKLNATTTSGNGGNISLENADNLVLQSQSQIATTAGAKGNGGNVSIDSDTVALINKSKIEANAFEGKGGNIQIQTKGLFQSPDSQITAASKLGINGLITIKNLDFDSSHGIVKFSESPIDVSSLIGNSCSGSKNIAENKFTIIGRGGLPINPDRALEINTAQVDLGEIVPSITAQALPLHPKPYNGAQGSDAGSEHAPSPYPVPIVEAQTWFKNNDGNIVLVGNNPNIENSSLFSSNNLACQAR